MTLYNNGTSTGLTTTADGTGNWHVNNVALTDGANYSFTAKATDTAGNTSAPSNALAFHDDQTPADTIPPSITFDAVSVTDTGVPGDQITDNPAVTFSGTVSDNAGVKSVEVFNGTPRSVSPTSSTTAGRYLLRYRKAAIRNYMRRRRIPRITPLIL